MSSKIKPDGAQNTTAVNRLIMLKLMHKRRITVGTDCVIFLLIYKSL